MALLKDVIDIISEVDTTKIKKAVNSIDTSSISKKSMEGTFHFPVIISRSLETQHMNLSSSSLERQFASFLQTVLSMNSTTTTSDDVAGYLKRFHQNMGMTYNKNDFMKDVYALKESFEFIGKDNCKVYLESTICSGSTSRVRLDNKEQLISVLESLNPVSINSLYSPMNFDIALEAKYNRSDSGLEKTYEKDSEGKVTGSREVTRDDKVSVDYDLSLPKDILKDNDVKKSNELVPITLHIKVFFEDDNKAITGEKDFVLGVKTTMHPVSTIEMVENITNACKKNGPFFNFIRWYSGEISFIKDLVLNIKETKSDVFNQSKGTSPWWNSLKRRKNLASVRNNIGFIKGKLLPNASIIMTMEEVDYIKTKFGYDMLDFKTTNKIMEEYFLLSFAVIDTGAEIAHFLFDGQTSFQSVTFDGLRRETSNATNINEVIRMANKLRI